MTALQAYLKLKELGYIEASELLRNKMKVLNESKRQQLFISDYDDKSYNSGLADWLQNNCQWFNNNRNGFTVCFHANII
jgi:hypothetical protein